MASGLVKSRATEMVAANPDTPSRTIAKMMVHKWPKMFRTTEQARCAVRAVRGNQGKRMRNMRVPGLVKPPGQAGWVPEEPPSIPSTAFPESLAKPWIPYALPGSRVLILPDPHIPWHAAEPIHLAVAEGRRRACDAILINGDLIDFYAISRFECDPEVRDLDDELDKTRDFLSWLRETFPRCEIVWKVGNHEERWKHYLWRNGGMLAESKRVRDRLTLDKVLDLPDIGVTVVDNRRIVRVGKLPVLHGHELARGLTTPVNPARGVWLRTSHTAMVGHYHRTSEHVEKDLDGKMSACWSLGCLCDLTPQYAVVNRWNHGFAVVEVAGNGDFTVSNHTVYQGVVR